MTFFDATPMGRIVNRFSKDTDTIDVLVPMNFQYFLMCLFRTLSTLVVLGASLRLMLVTALPIILLYHFIQVAPACVYSHIVWCNDVSANAHLHHDVSANAHLHCGYSSFLYNCLALRWRYSVQCSWLVVALMCMTSRRTVDGRTLYSVAAALMCDVRARCRWPCTLLSLLCIYQHLDLYSVQDFARCAVNVPIYSSAWNHPVVACENVSLTSRLSLQRHYIPRSRLLINTSSGLDILLSVLPSVCEALV